MSHPGTRRVPDDEEDIELAGTQLGIAEDDEIKEDHDFEDQGFISGKRNIKKKSCLHSTCRIILGIVATGVFTFMLIQLWSNYGDTIKRRVFAPSISFAGTFNDEGARGDIFNVEFLKWENSSLHLNTSKPTNELLQVMFQSPQAWEYEWKDDLLKIHLDQLKEVSIMAWSI